MRMLPNWYHGFLPADLWPDRPREFYISELDMIPLQGAAGGQIVREVVFSKRTDVIVFGGAAIITDTTGVTLSNPIGGTFSQVFAHLFNSAGNEVYTELSASGQAQRPLEHLFSMWGDRLGDAGFVNMGAKQPIYWTQPIVVRKGGSLSLLLRDNNAGGARHLRLAFWIGLMYEEREGHAA